MLTFLPTIILIVLLTLMITIVISLLVSNAALKVSNERLLASVDGYCKRLDKLEEVFALDISQQIADAKTSATRTINAEIHKVEQETSRLLAEKEKSLTILVSKTGQEIKKEIDKCHEEAVAKIDFDKVVYKKTIVKKRKQYAKTHPAVNPEPVWGFLKE